MPVVVAFLAWEGLYRLAIDAANRLAIGSAVRVGRALFGMRRQQCSRWGQRRWSFRSRVLLGDGNGNGPTITGAGDRAGRDGRSVPMFC